MAESKRARMAADIPEDAKFVTCTAPVNIAVIKYWGKRDEELILPMNSSLSGTLNQDELSTTTTVYASTSFKKDSIILNDDAEEEITAKNKRLYNCFQGIRTRALQENPNHPLKDCCVKVVSENNFPTAAGLASSAAGYACLVFSLAKLYQLKASDSELSAIARMGSGSACRSLFGGFVAWDMGSKADGSDSMARLVADADHWPEMEVLILVVNAGRKTVSSTSGMQTTVKTSPLMAYRASDVVPGRMKEMEEAIAKKDFATFAELTMKDSNQFHAVCLDTYPPISYMNDASRAIVNVLTTYNKSKASPKAAYTYDAGPNCVIYALKEDIPEILQMVCTCFPPANSESPLRGITTTMPQPAAHPIAEPLSNAVDHIIHTRVGPGPQVKASNL